MASTPSRQIRGPTLSSTDLTKCVRLAHVLCYNEGVHVRSYPGAAPQTCVLNQSARSAVCDNEIISDDEHTLLAGGQPSQAQRLLFLLLDVKLLPGHVRCPLPRVRLRLRHDPRRSGPFYWWAVYVCCMDSCLASAFACAAEEMIHPVRSSCM